MMELVLWILLSLICLFNLILLIVFFIKKQQKKKSIANQIDFMAKITHDLRTPIYAIDGYTLLSMKCLDQPDKVKIYLDKIKRISKQMMALVNDSIDLSKLQNNKLEVKEQRVDLLECLNLCIENIEAQLENKNIHFVKQIQIEHTFVQADSDQLSKIIINLLSNALKYTPSGGKITLFVLEKRKDQIISNYTFQIQDTGCGMSKEFQRHIFEPFTQEGKAENTDVSSSGLGMYIVKQLVDLMHGNITVDSKQSVGTAFTVSFDFNLNFDFKQ